MLSRGALLGAIGGGGGVCKFGSGVGGGGGENEFALSLGPGELGGLVEVAKAPELFGLEPELDLVVQGRRLGLVAAVLEDARGKGRGGPAKRLFERRSTRAETHGLA